MNDRVRLCDFVLTANNRHMYCDLVSGLSVIVDAIGREDQVHTGVFSSMRIEQ